MAVLAKQPANENDEWDHFADFQDDVDEMVSFVPLAKQSNHPLGTLDETEEEEDEDHFF